MKLTSLVLQMINVCLEVGPRVMIDNTGGEILITEVEVEINIVETGVMINKEIDKKIGAVIDREIDKEIEVVIEKEIEVVIGRGIEVVIDKGIEVVINIEIGVVINKMIGVTIDIIKIAEAMMDKEKKEMKNSMFLIFSICFKCTFKIAIYPNSK